MARHPLSFQADIAYGETDPIVTVFMGEMETDSETGVVSVRRDFRNPVTVRLSELDKATRLADPAAMQALAETQKAERVKARVAATALAEKEKVEWLKKREAAQAKG